MKNTLGWEYVGWMHEPLFVVDTQSVIEVINPSAVVFLGFQSELDLKGKRLVDFYRYPEDWKVLLKQIREEGEVSDFEVIYMSRNGEDVVSTDSARMEHSVTDGKDRIIIIGRDITRRLEIENELMNTNMRLMDANTQLKQLQKQLVQEKNMSSLGTLAAGIAHEMNNPISFVKSNLITAKEYIQSLYKYIAALEQREDHNPGKIAELRKEFDIDQISDDMEQIDTEINHGIDRVLEIIKSLDIFSISKSDAMKTVCPVEAVKKAVVLTRTEYHKRVRMELNLSPVPEVDGTMQELVQAFTNLLMNAFEACLTALEEGALAVIRISTRADESWVYCEIENTGRPIEKENFSRLFDPFFTTKPIGQGPGLGLTAVYQTIVLKYHGHIDVNSGRDGTMFSLRLVRSDRQ